MTEQEMLTACAGGRFNEWSTDSLVSQCRAQAREQLDPEYSAFMEAVANRLAATKASDERVRELERVLRPFAMAAGLALSNRKARPMAEQEMLTVEQCDRDAAAESARPILADEIRAGRVDQYAGVQAFARHRLAATKAADERVREKFAKRLALYDVKYKGSLGSERSYSHDEAITYVIEAIELLAFELGFGQIASAALAEAGGRGE